MTDIVGQTEIAVLTTLRYEREPICRHSVGRRHNGHANGGVTQRFSNWGPRTEGGPRRVTTWSARVFRKVIIVCTVFNNL